MSPRSSNSARLLRNGRPKPIVFHSKAADFVSKYLSNFETPIDVQTGEPLLIEHRGRSFRSIEHAFQAHKYLMSRPNGSLTIEDMVRKFQVGGEFDALDPPKLKAKGGKGAFKEYKFALDVDRWNRESRRVMVELVRARLRVDRLYRRIVVLAVKDGVPLYHFERSGEKSYWGGYFPKGDPYWGGFWKGENALGDILTEEGRRILRRRHRARMTPHQP